MGKCKICGWVGSTHKHHIIPICEYGENNSDNIVELCPNHHADSTGREEDFAKEHNLVGLKYTPDKIKALIKCSLIFGRMDRTLEEVNVLTELLNKYKFNRDDLMAYLLGVSPTSLNRYYRKD